MTDTLTPEQRADLRRHHGAMTPGPWRWRGGGRWIGINETGRYVWVDPGAPNSDANRAGVLATRNLLGPILATLDAQNARIAELEADNKRLREDLAAIYPRMRHTHPDYVTCAAAGPNGHPRYLR